MRIMATGVFMPAMCPSVLVTMPGTGKRLRNSVMPMTMAMTTGFFAMVLAEIESRRSVIMYTPYVH